MSNSESTRKIIERNIHFFEAVFWGKYGEKGFESDIWHARTIFANLHASETTWQNPELNPEKMLEIAHCNYHFATMLHDFNQLIS